MRLVGHECLAVAQRESITVPGDSWQGVDRIAATMSGRFYIVRRSKSLAIDTPANQALYSIVKLLESAFAADQA